MFTSIIVYFMVGLVISLIYCGKDCVNDIRTKKFNVVTVIAGLIVMSIITPAVFVYTFIEHLIGQH